MSDTLDWASSVDEYTQAMLRRADDWLTQNDYLFGREDRPFVLLAMVGFFAKEHGDQSKALLAELGTVP